MKDSWFAVSFFVAALLFAAMGSINTSSKASAMDPRSKRLARGEYLTTVMGCGDCHTPRTFAQALDNHRKYAGAVAAGWKAYNITSHRLNGGTAKSYRTLRYASTYW